MQPLIINSFSPKASIAIYGKNGEVFTSEVTNDAVNMNIVRGVDASAGMLTLNLVANKDKKGRSWLDRVSAMDYIEVRAGNKYLSSGKLPIRFRGFIDSVVENNTIPSYGGPLNRIQIIARDYVKLFLINNIQYLWVNMAGNTEGYPGLSKAYHIPAGTLPLSQLISEILEKIFNGSSGDSSYAFLPNLRAETGLIVPNINLTNHIPADIMIQDLSIQPYCGPMWSLVNYLVSTPLGESFVYDAEDAPILVCRPVPFKDSSGNFVSPAQAPELPTIKIDSSIVTGYSIGKTDAQVQNFFLVSSDLSGNKGIPLPAFVSSNFLNAGENFNPYTTTNETSNPAWAGKSTRTYGLKPLNIPTPWIGLPSNGNSFTEQAARFGSFLAKVYDHNETLRGGQIICHGDESIIHGRYADFLGTEFYIEQEQDQFSFIGDSNPTWISTLGVTRGQ